MSDFKGKVYQIGGVYEFSDDGVDWALDYLLEVGNNPDCPFKANQHEWELIREANYTMGTITPAPIELVNHNAYMFNIRGSEVIGLYCSDTETLTGGRYCLHYSAVSNIRLMTVEKK
jgi:hypothetical protein